MCGLELILGGLPPARLQQIQIAHHLLTREEEGVTLVGGEHAATRPQQMDDER